MNDVAKMRLAAMADLHYGRGNREQLQELIKQAADAADVLLLCGDLTDHGRPAEAKLLVEDVRRYSRCEVLAVLGNHDLETDQTEALIDVLEQGGVRVLDGDCHVVDGVGFAGVRGFGGGFDKRAVHPFGERELKDFIRACVDEALKLETALSRLDTDERVVLLHYAPIRATVEGEPPEIFPFLGASRLEDPVNHYEASVVFHGHAHKGSPQGKTAGGVPVFNVSIPVLANAFPDQPAFWVYELVRGG